MKTLILYFDGKELKFKPFDSPTLALTSAHALKDMPNILAVTIVEPDGKDVVIKSINSK